jgi:hypothetical protein
MLELPSWHVAWHSPSLVVAEAYENSDQEGSSELSASVEKTDRIKDSVLSRRFPGGPLVFEFASQW